MLHLKRPRLADLKKRYNMSTVKLNCDVLVLNIYDETLNYDCSKYITLIHKLLFDYLPVNKGKCHTVLGAA